MKTCDEYIHWDLHLGSNLGLGLPISIGGGLKFENKCVLIIGLKVKFTRPEGHKHLVSCSCSWDPITNSEFTNSEFTNSSNCVAISSCDTLVASLERVIWLSQSEGLGM